MSMTLDATSMARNAASTTSRPVVEQASTQGPSEYLESMSRIESDWFTPSADGSEQLLTPSQAREICGLLHDAVQSLDTWAVDAKKSALVRFESLDRLWEETPKPPHIETIAAELQSKAQQHLHHADGRRIQAHRTARAWKWTPAATARLQKLAWDPQGQ